MCEESGGGKSGRGFVTWWGRKRTRALVELILKIFRFKLYICFKGGAGGSGGGPGGRCSEFIMRKRIYGSKTYYSMRIHLLFDEVVRSRVTETPVGRNRRLGRGLVCAAPSRH